MEALQHGETQELQRTPGNDHGVLTAFVRLEVLGATTLRPEPPYGDNIRRG